MNSIKTRQSNIADSAFFFSRNWKTEKKDEEEEEDEREIMKNMGNRTGKKAKMNYTETFL